MSNVTVVGYLDRDPELRFISSGKANCAFSVCENRKRGEESEAHFYAVVTWNSLAENVAESLTKGSRVIVVGQLEQNRWEGQDGTKHSRVQIVAWQVGADLSFATAVVKKNERPER